MTDTTTSAEVLALLDAQLQLPCEYGRDGGSNPPCQYAADWSVTVHDCNFQAPHGCPKLFCEWHYLHLHRWVLELLELSDGVVVLPCGFILRRAEDFVWNAHRLHT